jgi:hypothetical protein
MPVLQRRQKTAADREAARRKRKHAQHAAQVSLELERELRGKQIREAVDRRRKGTPHGPECACPWCVAKYELAEAKANEIIPMPDPWFGWTYDGTQDMPLLILRGNGGDIQGLENLCPMRKTARDKAELVLGVDRRDCEPSLPNAHLAHTHVDDQAYRHCRRCDGEFSAAVAFCPVCSTPCKGEVVNGACATCDNRKVDPANHYVALVHLKLREPRPHLWQRSGVVIEWNLPHHGKGQPWCGEPLEWKGVFDGQANLYTWNQLKACGSRDCPKCGPLVDTEGRIVKAGTWERRTAQRVAQKIEGHLEDLEQRYAERALHLGQKDRLSWGKMHRPKLSHIVMSPPPAAWDDLPKQERTQQRWDALLREQCRLARHELGIVAGIRVVHGLRVPGKFNDREHAAEGLHFHIVGLTDDPRGNGWLDHKRVVRVHEATGWVTKRITERCENNHRGPCAVECGCNNGGEGPDPNRNVLDLDEETARKVVAGELSLDDVKGEVVMRGAFGTLLYLLSHASWPDLAVLRMPGEEWTNHGVPLRFNGRYPAFVKTSTQQKALQPFGDWTKAPETVVVMPLQEDINPFTGEYVDPEDVWAVQWKNGPPPPCPQVMVPAQFANPCPSERTEEGRRIARPDASVFAGLRTAMAGSVPAGKSWPPRSLGGAAPDEMTDDAMAKWTAYWKVQRGEA